MAYYGRGVTLNLTEVPDEILPLMTEWIEEANAKVKAEYDKIR